MDHLTAATGLGTAANVATACVPTATTDLGSAANMAATTTTRSTTSTSTSTSTATATSVSSRSGCCRCGMPSSSEHAARHK